LSDTKNKHLLPGISTFIAETNRLICKAAENDRPVFLTGEIGTEKAFTAKLVHQQSVRSEKPLSKVSVSWKLPPDLALYFEQCDGGSLIIHLQKEFPIDMQYTLVEMASDKSFADPMSGELIEADVRIIIMTSLDLESLAKRTPLLPELHDILINQHLEIPPLRNRLEDIPALVRYALKRAFETGRTSARTVDPQVLALFRQWHWPGNAEDLLLVTAQAAIATQNQVVGISDLPDAFLRQLGTEMIQTARTLSPTPSHTGVRRSSRAVAKMATEVEADLPTGDDEVEPDPETPTMDDPTTSHSHRDEPTNPVGVLNEPVEDESPTPDPLVQRVLAMAKRLHAQSMLLKNQMSGPLAQTSSPIDLPATSDFGSDPESLHSLENELDRGLDMVHSLRRQMAILNIRQQQSAETIRDLVQRISVISGEGSAGADREEIAREAQDLAKTLGQIDLIVQRVSSEVPLFGKHVEEMVNSEEK
jgi:Sigma-54 interaction domain